MSALSQALYDSAQIRLLEQRAVAAGLPLAQLMQRAGAAAWQCLQQHWPQARRIVVVAGAGNNGGDGYVLATLAHQAGRDVQLLRLGEHGRLPEPAAGAAGRALAAGVALRDWAGELPAADVYVDALLGLGLRRPPEGAFAEAIAALNAAAAPVLALDLPSGLMADTGAAPGAVVSADLTLTFLAEKIGLRTGRGPALCGELLCHGLDLPTSLHQGLSPLARKMVAADVQKLGRRARDAHKGRHGHLLVVGGDTGMAGAVALAAEAALRAGAGRVSVATRAAHTALLTSRRPELMCHGVEQAAQLAPLLARVDAVLLGPGLGQGEWGAALFGAVLDAGLPLLLDADGLNLLAAQPERREEWVLTPHPAEAARLLGLSTATVEADRPAAVAELQARYGGSVVLKGAGSLVQTPEALWLCPFGNPGMATAGMGDVLAGVIAALQVQGLPEPAALGVLVHARAGDAAAQAGERGLLASDVLACLRPEVNP